MITTERLEIIPLTSQQMGLWVNDTPALERQLNCHTKSAGSISHIVQKQAMRADADQQNWLFHAFWLIIRRADRVVVGSCAFKNPPDFGRTVEIGYGLNTCFEGQGYMTEAIKGLAKWALEQEGVSMVTAETEKDNAKSENVLKRAGFIMFRKGETNWWGFSGTKNGKKEQK
ncbi:MAG: GNAT family N-acetyltransferase [Defluviitaleaceae bacterium]|nr:GNAT family N-acetyltransferase [Defluviitaleaceae bacterium]